MVMQTGYGQAQIMQPTQDMGALDVSGNVSGSGQAQMMQPAAGMQQQQQMSMASAQGGSYEQEMARGRIGAPNPLTNMNTQTRNTDFGPVTISSPGFGGQQQMPKMQQLQDMRARPPQRGIGSFQNPFGGFMGGGRGQFMRPQPPMYGGGYGMQPPMFGGGMNYGMPPMFGGGMYGGGFGMQPPMYGGGFGMMRPIYGGGFGSPFSPGFGGGIGGMFPGMGGGYGMRPPMYGGGYNRPMPQPMPQPIRPMPQPIGPIRPMPIDRPRPIKRPMPGLMSIMETKGPGNLMRQRGGPVPLAQRQMQYPA